MLWEGPAVDHVYRIQVLAPVQLSFDTARTAGLVAIESQTETEMLDLLPTRTTATLKTEHGNNSNSECVCWVWRRRLFLLHCLVTTEYAERITDAATKAIGESVRLCVFRRSSDSRRRSAIR